MNKSTWLYEVDPSANKQDQNLILHLLAGLLVKNM